jgi:hypothetical protein
VVPESRFDGIVSQQLKRHPQFQCPESPAMGFPIVIIMYLVTWSVIR